MLQFSLTIIIGGACVLLASILRQRTVWTPGVLFSLVWLLVLLASVFDSHFRVGFVVPEQSFSVLSRGLFGAYIGFFLVHVFIGRSRVSSVEISKKFDYLPSVVSRLFPYVFCLALASSMGSLVEAGVDLSFSLGELTDLRKQHVNAEAYGVVKRISVYTSFLVSTFVVMLALSDFIIGKPNLIRVAFLMSSLVPLAFAKGSRIELVTPFFFYASALWLLQGYRSRSRQRSDKVKSRKARNAIILGAVVVAVVFMFYGQVRNVGQFSERQYGPSVRLALQISGYINSSLYAVGPVTSYMDTNLQRGYGRVYFSAVSKPMTLLGLVPEYIGKQQLKESYYRLGWIVNTPGTMIRHVTADWGLFLMPYICFLIAAFSSAWLFFSRPLSLPRFLLSVIVCNELLYSFHKIGLFSMSNAYILFIGIALSYLINARRRRQLRGNSIIGK